MRRLKRIIIVYRQTYPQARYHIQWHPALLYVAHAVLADSSDPEWQFYFLVCLYGYLDLHAAFRVAALCFRGLLTVALESGKLPAASARHLLQQLAKQGQHHSALNFSNSAIRVDAHTKQRKNRAATVDELALKFEEAARLTEMTELNAAGTDVNIDDLWPIDPLAEIISSAEDSE